MKQMGVRTQVHYYFQESLFYIDEYDLQRAAGCDAYSPVIFGVKVNTSPRLLFTMVSLVRVPLCKSPSDKALTMLAD